MARSHYSFMLQATTQRVRRPSDRRRLLQCVLVEIATLTTVQIHPTTVLAGPNAGASRRILRRADMNLIVTTDALPLATALNALVIHPETKTPDVVGAPPRGMRTTVALNARLAAAGVLQHPPSMTQNKMKQEQIAETVTHLSKCQMICQSYPVL